ncbi:MAG: hypothetical protein JNL50_05825 [Phycisphaerae bacterium]|nr:hypothetical protein [Phycisphaerae bacterium]
MEHHSADLNSLIQNFIAVVAPSGGVLRNQEPGVIAGIQSALRDICLRGIPMQDAAAYLGWLDAQTAMVLDRLRVRVRPWGSVRKALNMFMRSCICESRLRVEYGLDGVEAWAEMPLDSVVACALKREAGREKLPAWPGLKHLDRATSDAFQESALECTRRRGLPARLFLDYDLWLKNR